MIIIDKALEKRHQEGNPIRVAMVGGLGLWVVASPFSFRLPY